jgi:hypothetical protein
MAQTPVHVYQHIHNLGSIVETLYKPPQTPLANTDDETPTLSTIVDSYLTAHGYKFNLVFSIVFAFMDSATVEEFTDILCSKGMPKCEAEWIWGYIEM